MRTALVTGVVGQDGAYLARHLHAHGYRVIGTMPPIEPPEGFVEAYLASVDLRVIDLVDEGAMLALLESERPDEIYNLASVSSVAASWKAPIEVSRVNGMAFLGLLELVRGLRTSEGYDPRILQASSAEVFGTPVALPQGESHPILPTNPYAVAKAFAHFTATNYRDAYGMFVATVILFNHESPLRPASFVTRKITSSAVRIAAGLQDTLQLGRLDIRRDWGAASDYTRAMHLALQHTSPDDYVVASGASRELREFVEVAFDAAGIADPWSHVATNPEFVRPTDIAEMRGDASKARAKLGWTPTQDFATLVSGMVRADQARLSTGIEHAPQFLV